MSIPIWLALITAVQTIVLELIRRHQTGKALERQNKPPEE